LASQLADIPFNAIQIFLFSVIIYFMFGFLSLSSFFRWSAVFANLTMSLHVWPRF